MKNVLKNLILIILIIAVTVGIGFLVYRAVRSVSYNKEAKNPILTLEVEGYGEIKIELQPDYAPNTVATIIKLAQNGYYDGKAFYGTDSNVVACGMNLKTEEIPSDQYDENGNYIGPEGEEYTTTQTVEEDTLRVSDLDKSVKPYIDMEDEKYSTTPENERGSEDTDYKVSIFGEFVANGFNDNVLRFEEGTVGLYRNDYQFDTLDQQSRDSGTSLFFITTKEESGLNGAYCAFGKVTKGMDLIEKMLSLPVEEKEVDDEGNTTNDPVVGTLNDDSELTENSEIKKFQEGSYPVITKATVETYGVDYGIPEYMEAFDYNQYISDLYLQQIRNGG